MILKNKFTKEILNLTYNDFKIRYAKEVQIAIDSYCKTQLNKFKYKIKSKEDLEEEFYSDLQWNFNNFENSNWYIEK